MRFLTPPLPPLGLKVEGLPFDREAHKLHKAWGAFHDQTLRLAFLKLFASLLNGYRNFVVRKEGSGKWGAPPSRDGGY